MADHTLFVGLDVHKQSNAVATAPGKAGTSCTYYGTIANTPDALRRLCKKLAAGGAQLHFCYEDGTRPRPQRLGDLSSPSPFQAACPAAAMTVGVPSPPVPVAIAGNESPTISPRTNAPKEARQPALIGIPLFPKLL